MLRASTGLPGRDPRAQGGRSGHACWNSVAAACGPSAAIMPDQLGSSSEAPVTARRSPLHVHREPARACDDHRLLAEHRLGARAPGIPPGTTPARSIAESFAAERASGLADGPRGRTTLNPLPTATRVPPHLNHPRTSSYGDRRSVSRVGAEQASPLARHRCRGRGSHSESSPGTWCRRSALRSSVTSLAA